MLQTFQEKEFKSVSSGDLDLATPEEKEAEAKQAEENKDLFAFMTEALEGKVEGGSALQAAENPSRLPYQRGQPLPGYGKGPQRHALGQQGQGRPGAGDQ